MQLAICASDFPPFFYFSMLSAFNSTCGPWLAFDGFNQSSALGTQKDALLEMGEEEKPASALASANGGGSRWENFFCFLFLQKLFLPLPPGPEGLFCCRGGPSANHSVPIN
jgi:hypothetical protein